MFGVKFVNTYSLVEMGVIDKSFTIQVVEVLLQVPVGSESLLTHNLNLLPVPFVPHFKVTEFEVKFVTVKPVGALASQVAQLVMSVTQAVPLQQYCVPPQTSGLPTKRLSHRLI